MSQASHSYSTAPQPALIQETMSAQAPFSRPIVSANPPFQTSLEPADVDFLRKRPNDTQERKRNILLDEGQLNPDLTIVAIMVHCLREQSAPVLNKTLQNQFQKDREGRKTSSTRRWEAIVPPKHLSLLPLRGAQAVLRLQLCNLRIRLCSRQTHSMCLSVSHCLRLVCNHECP